MTTASQYPPLASRVPGRRGAETFQRHTGDSTTSGSGGGNEKTAAAATRATRERGDGGVDVDVDGNGEQAAPPPPPPPPPPAPSRKRKAGRTADASAPAARPRPPPAVSSPEHLLKIPLSRSKADCRARRVEGTRPLEAAAMAAAAAAAAAVATERDVAIATPALRPWYSSSPVVVSEFAKAAKRALAELDGVLSSFSPRRPLNASLLLQGGGGVTTTPQTSAAPPHPPPPLVPPGKAVALGPGGGRPLVPGRDVLVTLSVSEAWKPDKVAREVMLLATPDEEEDEHEGEEGGRGQQARARATAAAAETATTKPKPKQNTTLADVKDAFSGVCSADAAAKELKVSVGGGYLAMEGVVFEDTRPRWKWEQASSAGASATTTATAPPNPVPLPPPPPSYAAPIVEFLAAAGISAQAPPNKGDGALSEGRAPSSAAACSERASMRRGKGTATTTAAARVPWRPGDLSAAALSRTPMRIGGGSGYVFCHQGGCEHSFAVRDVRLACDGDVGAFRSSSSSPPSTEDDDDQTETRNPPTTGDFPLVVMKSRPQKARQCQGCGSRRATRATWGDDAAPSDPAFWCSGCYADAHYDDSGRLVVPGHRVVEYRGG